MATNNVAVCGIYPNHASLEVGVRALRDSGFRRADISVLCPATSQHNNANDKRIEMAAGGAATGASAGAVLGGVLAELATAGTFSIPGLGHFVAAGPLAALLMGAGGAIGGLAGGLMGLGVSGYEAQSYQEQLMQGGTLLSVQPDNDYWRKRAREIMERTGALQISSGDRDADICTSDCTSPTSA